MLRGFSHKVGNLTDSPSRHLNESLASVSVVLTREILFDLTVIFYVSLFLFQLQKCTTSDRALTWTELYRTVHEPR